MTISKARYDELMATRTRPLTDAHMSNARASRERLDAAAINPADDTAEVLSRMIADRQRRNTNSKVVPINGNRGRACQ